MSGKLNVLIFGSSGLVGSGVRDACLEDPRIGSVTTVVRKHSGLKNSDLTEIVHDNFLDYSKIEKNLSGFDACFWCIGISYSQAKDEKQYGLITKDYALEAAKVLKGLNPDMTFIYLSGAGTNINSKSNWARIKGEAEEELGKIGFKNQFNVRPASILSANGVKHRLLSYRIISILNPIFKLFFPRFVITNKEIGTAMMLLAQHGNKEKTLENGEMKDLIKEYSKKK